MQPSSLKGKKLAKPEKKVKKLEEYRAEHLPVGFLEPRTDEISKHSRSIEMYDMFPKYYWGKIKKEDRIGDKLLDPLERDFVFRGENYHIVVTPARIKDKDGVYRDYFPGKREEIIEDALRKLAVDGKGVYLDEYAAVAFTFYELRNELKRMGHTYSYAEIKKALEICSRTHLIITTIDGASVMEANMFESLGMRTEEDWKGKGYKTKCFVRFNFLVNKSVANKTYRYVNYEQSMAYKSNLARWLFKRMSHHFVQAHRQQPYTIMLSTIMRDFGMRQYPDLRNNLREVRKALKEMTEGSAIKGRKLQRSTLLKYEEHVIREGRKMVDVKFNLIPDFSHVFEMKKFNALFRDRINSK